MRRYTPRWVSGDKTAFWPISLPEVLFLNIQRRWQTRIPNKGYREQPRVPDRLKDSVDLYGLQGGNLPSMESFVPEEGRSRLLQNTLTSSANLKNYGKLDRLRKTLNSARNKLPTDALWNEVYLFLRTSEMCSEVQKESGDEFPKGQKLWIELEACEEKRVPNLMEMPNGLLVLPVFSLEECLDLYFSRTGVFESCWFPIPRMGSCWESFCGLSFPSCAIGTLEHFCTLATVALPPHQFGILINPGQRSSKFITYPEMVQLSQWKRMPRTGRNAELLRRRSDDSEEFVFDENLMTIFDTTKMELRRIEPSAVAAALQQRPAIPPIAQLELHLLLFKYPEISHVYVQTTDRPRWRTLLGESEKLTEIDIIPVPGKKPPEEFLRHLQRWSYMREFHTAVHVELTTVVPQPTNGVTPTCMYTPQDGELLRTMYTYRGKTLADELNYHSPLLDNKGQMPYEGYNYHNM